MAGANEGGGVRETHKIHNPHQITLVELHYNSHTVTIEIDTSTCRVKEAIHVTSTGEEATSGEGRSGHKFHVKHHT